VTKRDSLRIADSLNRAVPSSRLTGDSSTLLYAITMNLIQMLTRDNRDFDSKKFINAVYKGIE
jgi:hypothetical protein